MKVKIASLFKEDRWFFYYFFFSIEWIMVESETARPETYVFIREILD